MERQKLDVEQIIEILKENLCEEAIASAHQKGRAHATKEKELLNHELCGLEERLQNEYKALLN